MDIEHEMINATGIPVYTIFGDSDMDEYTPNLNKGDVIIFPSNFMYPHTVKPITSGKRYVVVTWFR